MCHGLSIRNRVFIGKRAQREVMSEWSDEVLRRECHDYYIVQSALEEAELENISLQHKQQRLQQELETKRSQAKQHTATHPSKHAVVTETKHLMEAEAASNALLRQSVVAQVRHTTQLHQTIATLTEKISLAKQRAEAYKTKRKHVERSLVGLEVTSKQLRSVIDAKQHLKTRVDGELRDRDLDLARLRHERAIAHRMLATEAEHTQEQRTWLKEARRQNTQLRQLCQTLGRLNTEELNAIATGQRHQDAAESNDGVHGDDERVDEAGDHRRRLSAARQLQRLKDSNLSLLQRMLNSVQMLQVQTGTPKGDARYEADVNH